MLISGYLVGFFGWRGMFIIEGLPAIVVAFIWWWLVDDLPVQAHWLPPHDRDSLEATLRKEQLDIKPMRNYAEAFRSPIVIMLIAQSICWLIGLYGFLIWLPSIFKRGSSLNIVDVGWLSAGPFLLAALASFANSFISDRFGMRKQFIWPYLVIAAVAFYASYLLGNSNYWISYALLVVSGGALWAPFGPFYAFITEALPRNVAGGALGLINGFGALGSFAGSYGVGALNAATGGPSLSYLFMAAALLVSGVIFYFVPAQGRAAPNAINWASGS